MSEPDARSATESRLAGVDATYRHFPKHVTVDATLLLPEVTLKWYDLAPEVQPVPDGIRRMAREYVERQSRDGRLEGRGLGFTILHRCGESFYFLIVNTWQNSNEVWESVYYKDGDGMPGLRRFRETATTSLRFACGSWGPYGTNSRPGRGSCRRREPTSTSAATSRIVSPVPSERHARQSL